MTVIVLPLRVINPLNVREFWAKRAKRTAAHRLAVRVALLGLDLPPPPLPCVVTFTRIAPRPFDDDGLAASMKGCRDSVAAHYGVDDGPRGPIQWVYAQRRGKPREYAVEVRLEAKT